MLRVVLLVVLAGGGARAADPPGSPASREAVARCEAVESLAPAARGAAYAEALGLADAALRADDGDALAHFAAFCALGGQLRDDGVGLAAPARLLRLRREVDRTLALAPDFADALAGKGALLLGLPRLLGGDPTEGERLLRRALEVDPDFLTPRFALVDALRARGAVVEARHEAVRALAIAERKRSAEDVTRARDVLAALGGAPSPDP